MSKKNSFWIPYADLMTVLMVIFLFISLSYMGLLQYQQNQQDKIFKEYKETKENLYNELKNAFKEDFKKWNLELGKDLSIKFTNPNVLFTTGSADVTPKFKEILKKFFPKYLNIILQEKYKNKIAEIRIEGHTDDVPFSGSDDPYIANLRLSQARSRNVLKYLRSLSIYVQLPLKKKSRLQFWLTADGLSYGRTLDSTGKLTYITRNPIDRKKSRRVQFRIITTSAELVDKIIKKIDE